jgi:hypothetical protein
MTRMTIAFVVLATQAATACGKDDSGATSASETTTSTSTTTGTSSESSTSSESTSSTSSSEETGPSCPFYSFQQPPDGNVGEPYEFIPEPTDEPKYWRVDYEAVVPGLTFGPQISGIPEAEGGFTVFASIVDDAGGVCQPEMFTLVIGPALPGDSTSSGDSTGSGSGSSSDGSGSDSGSSSTG